MPVRSTGSREWLIGGGEAGELIRSTDWGATPLGPRESWPASLRTATSLTLESPIPTALLWGRESVLLYNDRYPSIAPGQHPHALGRPLGEVAPGLSPIDRRHLSALLERAEAVYLDDQRFSAGRDGHRGVAHFSVCYAPVRIEDGSVGGALVSFVETTIRSRDLQHAAELLDLGDAFFELDRDWRIVRVNANQERLSGKPRSETVGRVFWELWPEIATQGSSYWIEYRRCMDERVPVQFDEYFSPLDLWTGVSAYPTSEGMVVFFRDITDRKRAEEAVRKRERSLAEAGHMAHLGVWEVDVRDPTALNSNELSWSDEVYRIFGYEPGAVTVSNDLFFEHVHPDDRERVAQAVALAIETRGTYSVEHRIIRRDGAQRIVQEHCELVFDEHGRLTRMIGAVQDITERKLAEDALLEADRRKDEFLAMLSHELRNPLAPIKTALHILDRASPTGEQAERARAIIDRQVNHLTRLVADLLDVSRITRGKIELHRERLDIAELVSRTMDDHRALFSARGVALVSELPPAPLWVDGDPTRLAQVLGNILQNAAKFTPEGGRVVVLLAQEGASVVLRVRDTGAGIAPEVMARLFEPFTQGDRSLARTSGGLGLGLAVVKGLVELHGGQVAAKSDGPGTGTELVIRLPVDERRLSQSPPRPELAHPGLRRVLVIEDNFDAAESLKEALEMDGHEVAVAFTGRQGIETARSFSPDVVFCDIGLPEMSGYDVARAFRSEHGLDDIPLVALTGYARPEDRRETASAGFDHHVAKPPDLATLERILAQVPPRAS